MSLKQKTISGVAWNGAGNIARQGLQVITLMVMARFYRRKILVSMPF